MTIDFKNSIKTRRTIVGNININNIERIAVIKTRWYFNDKKPQDEYAIVKQFIVRNKKWKSYSIIPSFDVQQLKEIILILKTIE